MMKRDYESAVQWIALNDEPTMLDPIQMADMISVLLVADLFGKRPKIVAEDVIRLRSAKVFTKGKQHETTKQS